MKANAEVWKPPESKPKPAISNGEIGKLKEDVERYRIKKGIDPEKDSK